MNRCFGMALGFSLLLAAAGCSAEGDVTETGDETSADGFAKPGTLPTLAGNRAGAASLGDVGNVTPGSACATASASVAAPPVHLVFMIDRSGSMGNSDQAGQNLETRWKPVVAGLESFFADSGNTNVQASIAFFGQGKNEETQCSSATYAKPAVSMRSLPDANAFSSVLDAADPGGNTPTKPALQGAIAYAQSLEAGLKPGERIAIVLATDGDPNGCSSTPENVAAEAAKVAPKIPTYVIGVGPDTTKLDTIAAGGGTGKAIMIPTSDPAQVSADLRAAVGQIKSAALGCNYALPAPPSGQTLDINAVNVTYTPKDGAAQTLAYSADCSNANGWHYDNASAPKEVVMCATSCSTLKADVGGRIDVVFGCATNGTVVR